MAEKKRLLSLDVLRGITVAGMILVNNGAGPDIYAPLKHSAWNGLTPCDLVFPFFLFITGISTYISLRKFNFEASKSVIFKIIKRAVIIILICWGIDWFHHICKGDFFPLEHLRLTGVLTRIGLCYGIVSLLAISIPHKHLLKIAAALLILYSCILIYGNGYVLGENNIISIIDKSILGSTHLYTKSPIDPEGLLGTLSAIAHTLIGFCFGILLFRYKDVNEKVLQLLLAGFVLIAIGWLVSFGLPLNKRIWSPSYVLVTCGGAASLLAFLMYQIDVKGHEKWSRFFTVFGVNPLFLYVLSEVLAIILSAFGLNDVAYHAISSIISNTYLASATYAVSFMLLLGLAGYPLYRKEIYIKI